MLVKTNFSMKDISFIFAIKNKKGMKIKKVYDNASFAAKKRSFIGRETINIIMNPTINRARGSFKFLFPIFISIFYYYISVLIIC